MQKEIEEKKNNPEDPQASLEKVLSTEIETAGMVSDARLDADKIVQDAQNNTSKLKNEIIEKARKERDRLYKEGVEKAHEESEKTIQNAKEEAEKFLKNGQSYLDEAQEQVMSLLLGLESKAK
jgi:vacuolar-type H+-ATPase subunit H